jgi:hypothetical protein
MEKLVLTKQVITQQNEENISRHTPRPDTILFTKPTGLKIPSVSSGTKKTGETQFYDWNNMVLMNKRDC